MLPQEKNPHGQDMYNDMKYALADAVAVFLKRGSNVILDIVFEQKEAVLYKEYNPYLVAIKPSLEVLQAREIARGDRKIGLAESQFSKVHEGISYDLEIDNSALTAEQAADKIIKAYAQAKSAPASPKPAKPAASKNRKRPNP